MYSKDELLNGIYEISQGKHTVQNCEKLAAIYTVMDHLYPEIEKGYSMDSEPKLQIGYGRSEFMQAVQGKNPDAVWQVIDELMDTIQLLNPKLYESVMRKI